MKTLIKPYQEFLLGTCYLISSTYLINTIHLFVEESLKRIPSGTLSAFCMGTVHVITTIMVTPLTFSLPTSILLYALYIYHKTGVRASWQKVLIGNTILSIHKNDLTDFVALVAELWAKGYTLEEIERLLIWLSST